MMRAMGETEREHYDAVLEREGWVEAATRAAYRAQIKSSGLRPWQAPLFEVADEVDEGRGLWPHCRRGGVEAARARTWPQSIRARSARSDRGCRSQAAGRGLKKKCPAGSPEASRAGLADPSDRSEQKEGRPA